MVVSLGPGKFYGSSLPRPRFYTDVKLSDDGSRVDPPLPVLDPLLSWAQEAHWSMGGLSFKRHRLQGRIEGSIKKLRAQEERKERTIRREKKAAKKERSAAMKRLALLEEEEDEEADLEVETEEEGAEEENLASESESEGDEQQEKNEQVEVAVPVAAVQSPARSSPRMKKRARSLRGEFDRAASGAGFEESLPVSAGRTRSPSKKTGATTSVINSGDSPKAAATAYSSAGRGKRIRVEAETPTPPRRSSRISTSPAKSTASR